MNGNRPKWILVVSSASLLLIFFLFLFFEKTTPRKAQAATQTPSSSLFFPVMMNGFPAQTVFGVEMGEITDANGLNQVSAIDPTWVRRNAVIWSDVEPSQGTYDWSADAGLESELIDAASRQIQVILIVRSTPSWAQNIPGVYCGPVSQAALPAFGSFMHDLVARYSVPPYNVKYWEIWNEPDVDPSLVAPDSVYGCWGNQNDPYYGGGYYAQMLQVVYPQIKAADPNAQVLVGGLLLNCNPNIPGACGGNNLPPQFLAGILNRGGGAYFDGVSFHAYDYYGGALGQYSVIPNWDSSWNTTGPAMIAKANYINSLLATYGVTGKFLMVTESGLLCDTCVNDSNFETTKAYYVAQVYAAAMAQGLRANVWYSVLGWRNSGLLKPDLSPLPAYTAYQFARSQLGASVFAYEITTFSGVTGYAFNKNGHLVWLLWSSDGSPHQVTLPNTPSAAWNVFGNSQSASASVTIGPMPLYFTW